MIFTLLINLILTAIAILVSVLFLDLSLAWWLRTQRASYLMDSFYKKLVFLEIKLPREVHKSPAAMEFVFNAIHQTLGHIEGIGLKKENGSWLEGITKYRILSGLHLILSQEMTIISCFLLYILYTSLF